MIKAAQWSIAARALVHGGSVRRRRRCDGVLYWVLATNVSREDDQFLVDTVQIMRAVIRERPNDVAALQQEVDWEGAARRCARIYVRVLDERGHLIIETPGASAIIGERVLNPSNVGAEPGPGIEVTSPAGAP